MFQDKYIDLFQVLFVESRIRRSATAFQPMGASLRTDAAERSPPATPASGERVAFEAPLPADFLAALTALREAAKPV